MGMAALVPQNDVGEGLSLGPDIANASYGLAATALKLLFVCFFCLFVLFGGWVHNSPAGLEPHRDPLSLPLQFWG